MFKTTGVDIKNQQSTSGVRMVAKSYKIVGNQVANSGKKVRRSLKKRLVRNGLVLINIAVLVAAIFLIIKNPNSSNVVKHGAVNQQQTGSVGNPLDQLSSADIAVQVARMGRLAETVSVKNNADSQNEQLALVASGAQTVSKPQIVTTALKSKKDIKAYTTVQGDTVASLAIAFGVTSDSIKWSNGLSGDSLSVGKKLYIPPVTGIAYEVKAGDTVDTVSSKFRANKDQVIADNDAEVAELKVGERILLRDGSIPPPAVAAYIPSASFAWGGVNPIYGSNGYDYGWCTWYAAVRRAEIGRPVPSNLGNAYSWYRLAQRAGIATGLTPAVGAVVVSEAGNHVSVVEAVNPDGSFWVSEMNSRGQVSMTDGTPRGGWNVKDFKMHTSVGALKFVY